MVWVMVISAVQRFDYFVSPKMMLSESEAAPVAVRVRYVTASAPHLGPVKRTRMGNSGAVPRATSANTARSLAYRPALELITGC